MPTFLPSSASAAARFAVTVDLADAALARADAHDVGHQRQRSLGQAAAAAELPLQRALLATAEHVERDVHLRDSTERGDGLGDGGLEVVADRAARGGQRHHDRDAAVVVDVDRADHAQLDDRAAQLRVDDGLERLEDLLA